MRYIIVRFISILFSSLGVLCPFALSIFGFFDPPKGVPHVCGLYILIPMAITTLLMGLLSLVGLVFGIIAYRRSARSAWNKLEAVIVSIPFLVVTVFIILFVLEDFDILQAGLI